MDSAEYHSALSALAWQIELGVDTCIADAPINRYEVVAAAPKPAVAKPATPAAPAAAPVPVREVDVVAVARAAAEAAQDLEGLRAAMAAYPHCELQKGARNLVFSDGVPGARVMIIGEAPGRDEDREGRPFVGGAGRLLDRMLAAIDLSRESSSSEAVGQNTSSSSEAVGQNTSSSSEAVGQDTSSVYITNVLPWRPPQNRDPKPEEIAMMQPFLQRHIALANPDVLVIMGNHACQALLGKRGITRLRGDWTVAHGKPALPMFHPAYLLRTPAAKREAWADLLSLKARLRHG